MISLEDIKEKIPPTIEIPKEFDLFYEWTKEHEEEVISGCFEWRSNYAEFIEGWFGANKAEKFGMFGAGSTGNIYAFWINENGTQKIVHIGSEGEEMLIIADNFIDFLRFLAIGYDDPSEDMNKTIFDYYIGEYGEEEGQEELEYYVNTEFQNWVRETFNVTIPKKGIEIINISDKTFEIWVEENSLN
ncbi:hypothetical protein [Aquimarina algicola]|uniref:SMI1/KNR4 family protein n=1 Tax=Aquimarina algicola TaxID=2589995 RepID=A0A504IWN4_9FLAO|nr:hypothetical protein [Aquimarina algicola]TPN82796.1 hypothetical protein FHK87_20430 [Aquimarina algicola]